MTEIKSELMQAIDWIDDFIARCNGDDRGSCDSVNLVRARVAELESGEPVRPMSDEQIAQWMPVGLLRTEEFVYQKGIKDAEKFHGIKGATE